jgi:PAS domain-containing protein
MAQREIEVILARHLAEHLALPIFIVDPLGNLLFYNEPAEVILGYRFDDTGPMPANQLATLFRTVDEDGRPLQAEELPIVKALQTRQPSHRGFWIEGLDGTRRKIEVTAFPLTGQSQQFLGAVAIFWEEEK